MRDVKTRVCTAYPLVAYMCSNVSCFRARPTDTVYRPRLPITNGGVGGSYWPVVLVYIYAPQTGLVSPGMHSTLQAQPRTAARGVAAKT